MFLTDMCHRFESCLGRHTVQIRTLCLLVKGSDLLFSLTIRILMQRSENVTAVSKNYEHLLTENRQVFVSLSGKILFILPIFIFFFPSLLS